MCLIFELWASARIFKDKLIILPIPKIFIYMLARYLFKHNMT